MGMKESDEKVIILMKSKRTNKSWEKLGAEEKRGPQAKVKEKNLPPAPSTNKGIS